jgi:hypothetical protein
MERADMAEHIPCRACEGTGDHWRHDPQPDDPELRTRIYGKPCEDEPPPVTDAEREALAAITPTRPRTFE